MSVSSVSSVFMGASSTSPLPPPGAGSRLASEPWGVSAQPLGRRADSLRMRLGASSTSRPPPRSRSRCVSVDPMGWWVVETADRLPRSSFVLPPTVPPLHGLFAHAVYCEVCDLWLNGQEQFADHLLGKKHKIGLRKRTAAEAIAEHLFRAICRDVVRMEQAAPQLNYILEFVKKDCWLATPALKMTTFASKATLRVEFRSEMAAAVVALAVTSHRGKKVAVLLAYWSGRIPHSLLQMQA